MVRVDFCNTSISERRGVTCICSLRKLSLEVFCLLATFLWVQAEEPFSQQAFSERLTAELKDPNLANAYKEAVEFCQQGDCVKGHEIYRRIIEQHPKDLIAIQCYLAVLGCYVSKGDLTEADALRKEFVGATERVLKAHAEADWTGALCCLMACCAARIQDSDPLYQSKALEFADKAAESVSYGGQDNSVLWQRAEVYGFIYEKRGQWPAAVRTYEQIIPQLAPPQSCCFKIRLAKALIAQAAATVEAHGKDDASPESLTTGRTTFELRERARRVLRAVVLETEESDCYGRLARQSLKDLESKEE